MEGKEDILHVALLEEKRTGSCINKNERFLNSLLATGQGC